MTRVIVMLYGVFCYALGLASILYAVGFTTGLLVPKAVDTGVEIALIKATTIDVLLVSLFAAQHSLMARQSFKSWWTRFVPKSIERSTYVMFSSFALTTMLWQWRPISGVVWSVNDPTLAATITALSLFGWLLVVASTFLINHFELFGLQQVTSHLLGRAMPSPRFGTPLFYKLVRHPLYLGTIQELLMVPPTTVGHLLFAVLNTAYILVGIMLEERDLTALFGDEYRRYRARVPKLIPFRGRGTEDAPGQHSH